jgi:Fe-Mn family superoxide dismutase
MKFVAPQYNELPGVVSAGALREHLRLYEDYVGTVNHPDSLRFQHALGGAILHELYFSQFTPNPSPVVLPVFRSVLSQEWGTVEAFWRDLREASLAAKGWGILAHRAGDKLRVLSMRDHEECVPGYEPLLVIDVQEHAYWMDYGTRKADYVDALWEVIDWQEIERRWSTIRTREGT